MIQHFSASIWKENDWYVAQCLDLDIASQGKTREEAISNLREALHLHFTPVVATITPDIVSLEVEVYTA